MHTVVPLEKENASISWHNQLHFHRSALNNADEAEQVLLYPHIYYYPFTSALFSLQS